ncbi:MAG: penicillin-binding transpeptidase domain-containing protein [Bacteroidetes bacterium]|nr:penicillin-binding transpeptidase domain-containing protein [Bacteroidota bacterium]
MKEFEPHHRQKLRIFSIIVVFCVLFLAISTRLFIYQIVDAEKYKQLARKQYEKKFILPAVRGCIYDRNGNVLVSNTQFISFAADPKIVGDKATLVAEAFAQVFQKPSSVYLEKLQKDPSKRFVWLERHVHPSVVQRFDPEKIKGVVVINEPRRLYHYDDIASTLIGMTDIDNRGIAGLELQYNSVLHGVDGSIVMQRDGAGRIRPSADYPRIDPVNGCDIVLTIDITYQSIVDEELKRGVEFYQADAGVALMLNPKTGELLALSTYPRVNPNELGDVDVAMLRNRAITDIFEPGSVYKIVTAAAAYEHKLVNPMDRFYAEKGKMRIQANGRDLRVITDTHPSEWLSFQEAMEISSNIVFVKVSKLIGSERFYRMARDFGFGMQTGIDLPGEVRGILRKPNEWSPITLQSMSYGYEVGTTPLQIACAYAALANNGILMKPYVVAEVRSPQGDIVQSQGPFPIRKVVSPSTVELLTRALEGVVERGTAKLVHLGNVRIAGKTGTSKKWVEGRYVESTYTASFVGFFPIEDPQIVCLVMLDNPKTPVYYGGATSGPIFRAIAERVVSTSYKFSKSVVIHSRNEIRSRVVPDVRMLTIPIAKKLLASYGLEPTIYGTGTLIMRQSPEPGTILHQGDAVSLILEQNASVHKGLVEVPHVCGMSLRRALNRLVLDDFEVKIHGTGKVISQTPNGGEIVKVGSRVMLYCEQHSIDRKKQTIASRE